MNYACPNCDTGTIKVTTTKTQGFSRVRYLRCSDRCGWTGKQHLSLDARGRIIFPTFLQHKNNTAQPTPDQA